MTEDAQLDTQVALLNPVEYQVLERYRRIRRLLDQCLDMGLDLEEALEANSEDNDVAMRIIDAALLMEEPLEPKPSPEEE